MQKIFLRETPFALLTLEKSFVPYDYQSIASDKLT
jgi:hypothetical protein